MLESWEICPNCQNYKHVSLLVYWLDVMWVVSELGHITAFRTPSVVPWVSGDFL